MVSSQNNPVSRASQPMFMRAVFFMILGMVGFTFADLFVKLSSQTIPSSQVLTVIGLGTGVTFALMMLVRGEPLWQAKYIHKVVLLRSFGEFLAAFGILLALAAVPLGTITAVMQVQPLVLTVLGAVFLKEAVGWRRISAVLFGLIGVLIILRPGMAGFNPAILFALVGVAGMSIRDMGSRLLPTDISTSSVSYVGAMIVGSAGLLIGLWQMNWVMPQGVAWWYLALMVLFATAGVFCVTTAMRLAEVSAIGPFRYVRVIFGIAAGVVFLGETIDGPVIVGSFIVVGAGLYAWQRERRQSAGGK